MVLEFESFELIVVGDETRVKEATPLVLTTTGAGTGSAGAGQPESMNTAAVSDSHDISLFGLKKFFRTNLLPISFASQDQQYRDSIHAS
jgi:hypothetical protein